VADPNRRLAERVEVFTRVTSDALQKAVGDVLEAKSPWQLLYRLSRIVLLGLVLYTAWLLITLQPDLARRMRSPTIHTLQQQVSAHQSQVQNLLRSSLDAAPAGLHSLVLLQWDGDSGVVVLAADGRSSQLGMAPGQQLLLGVEMAEALGRIAMGLCASGTAEQLPLRSTAASRGVPGQDAGSDGEKAVVLLCPVGCGPGAGPGLLLGVYEPAASAGLPDQVNPRRQEQLLLLARRLGDLLAGG
jgi:hypothetical protein